MNYASILNDVKEAKEIVSQTRFDNFIGTMIFIGIFVAAIVWACLKMKEE